jgi:hypothetical protein
LRASRAVGEAMKKKGGEAMKKKSDGAMKKIIKVYREIKRVEVFDDYIVEVDLHDKKKVVSSKDARLIKEDVLNNCEHLITFGYGEHADVEVWQLPEEMRLQINWLIGERYSCLCDDNGV